MRVLVAMSGGVDSAVAAALLQEQGHDVVGVTMKLWGGDADKGCCSVSDVDDARRVADHLGIEHHVFNFGDDFDAHVVEPYVEAHRAGLTPNPCIECNRHVKFDKLLRRADALGFDAVATGHHARIRPWTDGSLRVARGDDGAKDQSYVLHMLTPAQLGRIVFPVGEMTKDDVRAVAARIDLRIADKPDSQDVCFITANEGRHGFLSTRLDFTPGRVVTADGDEVGSVDAVELVTLGQRKGLGVGGNKTPRYAVDVDVSTATVTIGPRRNLMTEATPIVDLAWAGAPIEGEVQVQTSAHGSLRPGSVDGSSIAWSEPQQKVAAGQSVVLYVDDLVVGSALAG